MHGIYIILYKPCHHPNQKSVQIVDRRNHQILPPLPPLPPIKNQKNVKRGSNTDLSFGPGSQQNPHDQYAPQDAFVDEMAQRRAKREAQERSGTQTEGPRRR